VTSTAEQTGAGWTRIENWLARHAPQVHAALSPPASESTIGRAGQIAGTELPEDIAAWWRRSHGLHRPTPSGGNLFPDRYDPVPLDDALEQQAELLEMVLRTAPAGLQDQLEAYLVRCAGDPAGILYPHDAAPAWLPAWIPVAQDTSGGGLFADLRSGPRQGCLVRYTRHGHAAEPDWPDLTSLLTHVADGLDSVGEDDFAGGAPVTIGRWTVPGPSGR